jgi:diacylglycerol O-acyltransferase
MNESTTSQLKPADAVMWNIEVDPILRSTVVAVAQLDASPDWDELRARVEDAVRLLPRLRQRIAEPRSPLGLPEWVEDSAFSVDYHVRRVRAPAPGTMREVLDLAAPIAMDAFDAERPLWELVLVEGLDGGGAALVQKFHHSIMDGEGAIAFERKLLDQPDGAPEPGGAPEPETSVPAPRPGTEDEAAPTVSDALGEVLREARERGRWVVEAAVTIPVAVTRSAVSGVSDPVGTIRGGVRLVESLAKGVAPVPESESTLLRGRSLDRRFETIDLALEDLRAAGHACGGTVNDAFLAAVVGGLMKYHERLEAPVDLLHLTMPVSLRHHAVARGEGGDADGERAAGDTGDPDGDAGGQLEGNKFAPVRFPVPATITDPAERIRTLGELTQRWQREPFLEHTDLMATALARLPAPVAASIFGGMLKHVDAVATNVAGLREGGSLAGATILREYAFAPPTGAGLNVSLVSHLDRACIGVSLDVAAVTDDELFMTVLVEAFDEVIAVGAHHAHRTA